MREVEVKIPEAKHEELKDKLLSLGAEKVFEGELHYLLFDTEDDAIRSSDGFLRLRKEGERVKLTFKEKITKDRTKTMDETEFEVSSFGKARKFLKNLGFKVFREVKKHRISYSLDGVHFEFDKCQGKYKEIPEFMEIEAKDPDTVYKYARKLGFEEQDCRSWSLRDLEKHYLGQGKGG